LRHCFLFTILPLFFWVSSNGAYALDIKDRLELPSKVFPHVELSSFIDVSFVSGRLIAIGERGVIAYSDDGGDKWVQAEVPVSITLTAMHFPDEKHGWAVGHSGVILHSKDQGETWQVQFEGNQANKVLFDLAKNDYEQAKVEFEQAEDEEKEDLEYAVEGAEFAFSNAEFDSELGPANPFLDVWFRNEKQGYAVGAYGLFFVTTDGGETWLSA